MKKITQAITRFCDRLWNNGPVLGFVSKQKGWLAIAYSVFLALLLGVAILKILDQDDIRGVESNVLYTVLEMQDSRDQMYTDPNEIPYSVTQYSPLYYVVADLLVNPFISPTAPSYATRVGTRLVSSILLIFSCLLFFFYCRRFLKIPSLDSALLASLIFVAPFPWYFITRPDVLVLLVLLSTTMLIHLSFKRERLGLFFGVGALFAFGVASKLNAAAFPFIYGLFLLYNRKWKGFVALCLGFAVAMGGIFAFLEVAGYDQTFVKENAVDGIKNGVFLRGFIFRVLRPFIVIYWPYLILTAVAFAYFLRARSPLGRYSFPSFLIWISTGFFIMISIAGLKIGSAVNYYDEFLVLTFFFLAYAAKVLKVKTEVKNLFYSLLFLSGIYIMVHHFLLYAPLSPKAITERIARVGAGAAYEAEQLAELSDLLDDNLDDKYFFSDNIALNLKYHDHVMVMQRDIHNVSLRNDVFDYTQLQEAIENGDLRFIIYRQRDFDAIPFYGIDLKQYFDYLGQRDDRYVFVNRRASLIQ